MPSWFDTAPHTARRLAQATPGQRQQSAGDPKGLVDALSKQAYPESGEKSDTYGHPTYLVSRDPGDAGPDGSPQNGSDRTAKDT